MLTIRLLRTGKKNQPSFKLVVVEKNRSSTSGRFVQELGFYNPLTKEKVLKEEKIKYWISVGAKPSQTIHNLLVSEKIIKGKKIPKHKKKAPKESPEGEQAPYGAGKHPTPVVEQSSLQGTAGQAKEKEEKSGSVEVPAVSEIPATEKEKPAEQKPAEEKPTSQEEKIQNTG